MLLAWVDRFLFEPQKFDFPFNWLWMWLICFKCMHGLTPRKRVVCQELTKTQLGAKRVKSNSVHLWQMVVPSALLSPSARHQDIFTPLCRRVTNYALAICTGLQRSGHTSVYFHAEGYHCLKTVEFRITGVRRFIMGNILMPYAWEVCKLRQTLQVFITSHYSKGQGYLQVHKLEDDASGNIAKRMTGAHIKPLSGLTAC